MVVYRLLADLIVVIHFSYVLFVILGLVLTLAGGWLGWNWVRNRWFRWIHLGMISVVVLEAWCGITCPLTTWENALREKAGDQTYQGDFIAAWVHEAVFFETEPWVMTLVHTSFGAAVVASLLLVPPARRKA